MTPRTATAFAVLALGLSLVACNRVSTPPATEQESAGMPVPGTMTEEKQVMNESGGMEGSVKVEVQGGMMQQSRIVAIAADNWSFAPNAISVKKGEDVKVRLTGVAGMHGFSVPELGINTAIAAGKTVDVDLPTGTAGTFAFRCSIPCGAGHKEMTGTITISE